MPRNVSGDYFEPPGTTATTQTVIASAPYNAFVADMVLEQNNARPVKSGGTGATTADAALTNFGGTATGKAVFTAASKSAAQAAIGAELPAGAVMHFAMTTAPTGWLKANGQAVSRTTYATLFAAIGTTFGSGDGATTFNLPDLRGEFVRGWDDSRSVDAGRVMGTAQSAAMLDHTHSFSGTTSTTGAHTHTISYDPRGDAFGGNPAMSVSAGSSTKVTSLSGDHSHTISGNTGNPSAGGGTETRPRNIALLACIKI